MNWISVEIDSMDVKKAGIASIVAIGCTVMAGGSIAESLPKLEGTNWQLKTWTAQTLVENTKITLSFAGGRLAGSAGCNRYVGGYEVKAESFSVKREIATTMMACPEPRMKQEQTFLTALKGVREYTVNRAGELQLAYRTADGLGLLTFAPAPGDRVSPRR
jgi:heat shock protein HslJ